MTKILMLLLPIGQVSGQPADWGRPPSPGAYDATQADVARWRHLARSGDIRLAITEINVAVPDMKARRRYMTLAKVAYRSQRRRRVCDRAEAKAQARRERIAVRDQLATLARAYSYVPAPYAGSSCNHERRQYAACRSAPYVPATVRSRYGGNH